MGEGRVPRIAVVGLWHLGCVLCAAWSKLRHEVVGVDFDLERISSLRQGRAPLYEPALDEALASGMAEGRLSYSSSAVDIREADFVFLADDTPVLDDDRCDLTVLEQALARLAPHFKEDVIVIVSSQMPVGTCRRWRTDLRASRPSLELVYSPENLRLGEALSCYLNPSHIVIGVETETAWECTSELFAPMKARLFRMNLNSAEMVKHGINSFLAMSVTFSNQLADLCQETGGDFQQVVQVLRSDPRIGERAYLSTGLGFSGGTLGRDLRVLEEESRRAGDVSPLFGQLWSYNRQRSTVVARRLTSLLGSLSGKRIGVQGLTYKPGTSTLRRSRPLEVVQDLLSQGAEVQAFDPRADWSEATIPRGLVRAPSALAVGEGADAVVLLTAWPEFRDLDLQALAKKMRGRVLFDAMNLWVGRPAEDYRGLNYVRIGVDPSKLS